ncbi:MAG: uracil-DNA glycosylase [Firmicutes bacterium]|nr:uracil-DNA glycosylase [Bacillota bacterium]
MERLVIFVVKLGSDWDQLLAGEFQKPYYLTLKRFLRREYAEEIIYPETQNIFEALKQTPYSQAKVVLLGQDPYHGPGQAHGLAFSVPFGVPPPPSLRNVFMEIKKDLGVPLPHHGCLLSWARQGVLLLNTVLTVQAGKAGSHQGRGWEIFTEQIIRILNRREKPLVFLLWGRQAQSRGHLLTNPRHLVLRAAHPSPLSAFRGFFGSAHFSQANRFLESKGQSAINWGLPEGCP